MSWWWTRDRDDVQRQVEDRRAHERDREALVILVQESQRRHDLIVEKLVASREQLAALRSSFEWLTTHVNQLQAERSQLFARVLGLSLPAMEIGVASVTPGGAEEARMHGVPIADSYEHTVPGTQVATSMFEDPGDDDAAKLGIKHDPVGNVIHAPR